MQMDDCQEKECPSCMATWGLGVGVGCGVRRSLSGTMVALRLRLPWGSTGVELCECYWLSDSYCFPSV